MKTERGFTLLEVLVALAILAIALGALVKGGVENARNAAYLRDKALAHWVAMNKVTELQLEADWPTLGNKRGKTEMAGRDWLWRTTVAAMPEPFETIRSVEVEVRTDEDSDPLARVTGAVARPRAAQPIPPGGSAP